MHSVWRHNLNRLLSHTPIYSITWEYEANVMGGIIVTAYVCVHIHTTDPRWDAITGTESLVRLKSGRQDQPMKEHPSVTEVAVLVQSKYQRCNLYKQKFFGILSHFKSVKKSWDSKVVNQWVSRCLQCDLRPVRSSSHRKYRDHSSVVQSLH